MQLFVDYAFLYLRIIPFFLHEISERMQRAVEKNTVIQCEFTVETRCRNSTENLRIEGYNRKDSTHVIHTRRDAIIMENETPGNARQHLRTKGELVEDENCRHC